jgi:eukaryotic-like serine/threonine-protein kinase
LSKHYFNCGRVLRIMGRSADAVAVAVKRRELWQSDGEQLFQVALELNTVAEQMDKTSARDEVLDEAVVTLEQAESTGFELNSHQIPSLLRKHYEVANEIARGTQP